MYTLLPCHCDMFKCSLGHFLASICRLQSRKCMQCIQQLLISGSKRGILPYILKKKNGRLDNTHIRTEMDMTDKLVRLCGICRQPII